MTAATGGRMEAGARGDADAVGRELPAWVTPRIRAERRDAYGLLWVGLGGVVLFALALRIPHEGTSPWFFVVFGAVVAGVLGLGAHHAVRNRRYRDVVLALDAVPVVPGGRLRGMLETEVPAERAPRGGFLVTFGCYRRYERQDSDGHRQIVFEPLWEEKKWMRPRPRGDGPGVAIPVAFDAPPGLPQTSGDPGAGRMKKMWGQPERIAWRVHARANVSGSRFRTVVEVPVLDVDEARVRESDGAPPESVYAEAEVRDRYDEPESPGVGMERLPGGGVRFSFAPARHRGLAVGMTLTAAAAPGLVLGAGPHPALAAVLLLVAAAAGYGAWRYWTFASTVTVRGGRVEVWHGAAGRRSTTVLPCEAVEAVRVGPRSDGRFDVRIVPRGGGEHLRAARGIDEREEAGWIAARIEEAAARRPGSTA